MENSQRIEFVIATNNYAILEKNLLRSEIYKKRYAFNFMKNFNNISKAYNIAPVNAEIIIFLHQDIFLPPSFENDLLISLKTVPNDWQVLGVAGVKLINGIKHNIGYINDRGRTWGRPDNLPHSVQTLDEMLLITHGDIEFDEMLDCDFYGADICLNRKCYAINAYCYHNSTRKIGERTESFYRCERYFKAKWEKYLPLVTTCSILT